MFADTYMIVYFTRAKRIHDAYKKAKKEAEPIVKKMNLIK